GLAAAAKCTPLPFAAYFAWSGRYRAAAAVVGVAVAANLLPDALYPAPDGHARLGEWAARFVTPVARADVDPGYWHTGMQMNHSLGGVARRLFTADLGSANGVRLPVPRADRVDPGLLKAAVLAAWCGL